MDLGGMINSLVSAPFICIGWVIIGAIAGELARRLRGARDQGFLGDIILGILGAFVGGFLVGLFGLAKPDGGVSLVIVNLIVATVGAAVLVTLRQVLTGRK